MKTQQKIVLTTFSLFMVEAILHYNIGKNDKEENKSKKGFLPPGKSLMKIGIFVLGFSLLNAAILKDIQK
tara:strand:+ start:302 stop:511 length:210 start_codon:yes stop_codon:yes gene_type:complete